MPIYEYLCEKCGKEFELIVFKEEDVVCPECGNRDLKKKMSTFGFSVGYKFTPSSTGKGSSCSGCSSTNCSSCS